MRKTWKIYLSSQRINANEVEKNEKQSIIHLNEFYLYFYVMILIKARINGIWTLTTHDALVLNSIAR